MQFFALLQSIPCGQWITLHNCFQTSLPVMLFLHYRIGFKLTIRGLAKGVGRRGLFWFALICYRHKSEEIGANRNKSEQIGVFQKTRNANRNKSEENGEIGTNQNKSGWPPPPPPFCQPRIGGSELCNMGCNGTYLYKTLKSMFLQVFEQIGKGRWASQRPLRGPIWPGAPCVLTLRLLPLGHP